MPGGVEGDALAHAGLAPQDAEVLVDVRVVFQPEEVLQPPGILLQDGQGFAVEEQGQGQADVGAGLDRMVGQPRRVLHAQQVGGGQVDEIGIAQAGIAAKQEGVERVAQFGRLHARGQPLHEAQLVGRQIGVAVRGGLDGIVAEGVPVGFQIAPPDSLVDLLLQVLEVFGHGIGVIARLAQVQFKVGDKLVRQVGKLHAGAEALQEGERGAEVVAGALLDAGLPHFGGKEVREGLPDMPGFQGVFQLVQGDGLPLPPQMQFLAFDAGHELGQPIVQRHGFRMVLHLPAARVPLLRLQVYVRGEILFPLFLIRLHLDQGQPARIERFLSVIDQSVNNFIHNFLVDKGDVVAWGGQRFRKPPAAVSPLSERREERDGSLHSGSKMLDIGTINRPKWQ